MDAHDGDTTHLKTGPVTLLIILLSALSAPALAQGHTQNGRAMATGHGGTTLFLAQAAAANVVPPGTSSATATGVFLIDHASRTVNFDLTFQGLEHGPPKKIALYNFGVGGNGALVHTICGDAARPCPDLASANITGAWDGQGRSRLDGKLLGEFASARVYLEIVGGDGKPEIRGQLEPNDAMVPVKNYLAHLEPAPGVESHGVGTAVLSEVHFPDGRVAVFYHLTVARTSGTPRSAALVGVPAATGQAESLPRNLNQNVLPRLKLLSSDANATGGTMTGEYEVDRRESNALFATNLLATGSREVGIAVSTSRFPDGELYGAFKPVN